MLFIFIQCFCFCIFFMVLLLFLVQSQAYQFSWLVDGGLLGIGVLIYGLSILFQKKMFGMFLDDFDLLDFFRINCLDWIVILQASEKVCFVFDIILCIVLILFLGLLVEFNSCDNFGVVFVMWLEIMLFINGII